MSFSKPSGISSFGRYIFLCIAIAGSNSARAQEQWEKEGEGEIKDVEIEITKERQLTLPRANRNFERIPPRPYEPIKPAIKYEFRNFKFTSPDFNPIIRPLRLKPEEISRMNGNYLSAGFGNYSSFFGQGSATTKRSKDKLLGADFYWRSFGSGPVGGKNSASSATRIKLFGKRVGNRVTTNGDVSYQKSGTYFYGYDPALDINRDRVRQSYEKFSLQAGMENTKRDDFNYQLNGAYSQLRDFYKASESEFSITFSGDYKIKEGSTFYLTTDLFIINRKDSLISSESRTLFRIKPAFQFSPMEKFQVTAGLNLAVQNDATMGSANFHAYPSIKVKYELSPDWEASGSLSGDIDKVNLHTLTAENLWLGPNNILNHTNRTLDFSGGLRGRIGRAVTAGGGVSIATLKYFYFYQNVRDDLNPSGNSVGFMFDKFAVVYDVSTQRVNPYAEVNYSRTETVNINIRADYFNYSTETLPGAWHRPAYRLELRARYNIFDKCVVQAGLTAQGGMKSRDPATSTIISLDPAVNLNIHTRYFFSSSVSAFLQLDNLLSNQYPLYQSYAVRGFQALGGVSWSF